MMRCDMANMLRQAARAIRPEDDSRAYAFSLTQAADHIDQVREGKASLEEFADFYLLRPREPGTPSNSQT